MTGWRRRAQVAANVVGWSVGATAAAALTVAWGWLLWGAAAMSPPTTAVVLGVFIVVNMAVCRVGKLDNQPTVDTDLVDTEPVVDDRELKHFMSRDWDKPLRKEVP